MLRNCGMSRLLINFPIGKVDYSFIRKNNQNHNYIYIYVISVFLGWQPGIAEQGLKSPNEISINFYSHKLEKRLIRKDLK
jgi:hypothetical protein